MLPFLLNHSAVGSAQPALPIRRRLGEGGSQSNGPVRRSPELVERGEGGSIPAVSLSNPSKGPALSKRSASNGPALFVRHRLGEGGSLSNGPALSLSKGFTIVEVMMASVILVVGFVGMIQAITLGSEMLATARRQTLAAQILDHEIGRLRLKDWTYISALTSSASATYSSDQASINTAIAASGVSFTLSSTVSTITTDLREVAFTVTWTKSGTNTAATTPTGSWLSQLSFSSPSPIARTYTRKSTAYFGKYGLNLKL